MKCAFYVCIGIETSTVKKLFNRRIHVNCGVCGAIWLVL